MAKKKSTALEKRGTTAMTTYDAEFAKYAKDIASKLSVGGTFISFKSGRIAIAGKPVQDNKLKVVIVDNVPVNTYYGDEYDEDDKKPPTCFSIGRMDGVDVEVGAMKAHPNARAGWQNKQVVGKDANGGDIIESPCAGCPQAAMGTDNRGKGKACKNTMRLGLLSAEDLDADSIKSGEVLYAKLSVLNVKHFALYAKGLDEGFKRPPFAAVTTLSCVPDDKSQFRVTFEMDNFIPKELAGPMIARHKLERANTGFAWNAVSTEGEGVKKKDKKSTKKNAERRRGKLR